MLPACKQECATHNMLHRQVRQQSRSLGGLMEQAANSHAQQAQHKAVATARHQAVSNVIHQTVATTSYQTAATTRHQTVAIWMEHSGCTCGICSLRRCQTRQGRWVRNCLCLLKSRAPRLWISLALILRYVPIQNLRQAYMHSCDPEVPPSNFKIIHGLRMYT